MSSVRCSNVALCSWLETHECQMRGVVRIWHSSNPIQLVYADHSIHLQRRVSSPSKLSVVTNRTGLRRRMQPTALRKVFSNTYSGLGFHVRYYTAAVQNTTRILQSRTMLSTLITMSTPEVHHFTGLEVIFGFSSSLPSIRLIPQ